MLLDLHDIELIGNCLHLTVDEDEVDFCNNRILKHLSSFWDKDPIAVIGGWELGLRDHDNIRDHDDIYVLDHLNKKFEGVGVFHFEVEWSEDKNYQSDELTLYFRRVDEA